MREVHKYNYNASLACILFISQTISTYTLSFFIFLIRPSNLNASLQFFI